MDMLIWLVSAIAACLAIVMMFLTVPTEIGPVGVLVFFTLIYIAGLALAVFGCRLFFWLRGKLNRAKVGGEKRKSYYYGLVLAMAPVLFLACGSFGGVTWIDLGLVALLEAGLCFLVSKNVI
ncbi:hypothetical protein IKF15_02210 [Candidatus Saccharibacteria bacterium]|nr:hypothetical protein [Candidatus Saccharibacteria bacterium]